MKVTAEPSPPAAPPWKAQKRSCAQTAEGPASEGPRGFSYGGVAAAHHHLAPLGQARLHLRGERQACGTPVHARSSGVIRQAYFHGIDASELGT